MGLFSRLFAVTALYTVLAIVLLGCSQRDTLARDMPPLAGQRPNFLLIVTDDHGYGDVSTYQVSDVQTPNIDRLATEGMLFTAMRSNSTVCSPSRAALLTGRFPDRVGVPGVIRTAATDSWGWFDPNTPTLANYLRGAGYHTAIIGKWHLGLASPNLPNERGFEYFHGFLGDMMDDYMSHTRHGKNYMRLNTEEIRPVGHATELFTDWSIDYLRQQAQHPQRPFFLYLAYNAPHFPIQPPAEDLARVRARMPELSEKRARNVAFVEHLDRHIGRILGVLDECGLAQNTFVAFTSDNGGSLPHGQSNRPWRDGKQSHYDGGLRVPFMVRWPTRISAGARSDYHGQCFDLFPTLLALAGVSLPSELDAVSLMPIFAGQPMVQPRDLYFVRREGGPQYGGKSYEALIRGEWKLLQNGPYSQLELYNLRVDPQETRDVAADHAELVRELSAVLQEHVRRGGATAWQAPHGQK